MAQNYDVGRLLSGVNDEVRLAAETMAEQEIDQTLLCDGDPGYSNHLTTLGGSACATGPGTFLGKTQRTLQFEPTDLPGWWIDRSDLDEQLNVRVSCRNIWTSARNIVLRSGNPHNYLRMVEHIVALRIGLGIDNVLIRTESGDPPLFNRSSIDLVEAMERVGIVELDQPAAYVTVKEPVTIGGTRGDFVTVLPAAKGDRRLRVDCAIDFDSAIGRQRILFDVTPENFRYGALARTNATLGQMAYVKTLGQLFADTRNLGYSTHNILIHGPRRYFNEPKLQHQGKPLEAVWHRATLDLLAAVALIDIGRFAGTIVSYRAGHTLDCRLMTLLYRHDLLEFMKK